MTIAKLHKLLGKLVESGHGRVQVCVNKETFKDPREADGVVMLPISGAILRYIGMANDDGGILENADGSERHQNTLLIYGNAGEPKTGLSYEQTPADQRLQ